MSEAFHFPKRSFSERHELEARLDQTSSENPALVVSAKRLTRGVHIVDPHYRATLDWFHLSPATNAVFRCLVATATRLIRQKMRFVH